MPAACFVFFCKCAIMPFSSIAMICPLCKALSDHAEVSQDLTLNQKTIYRLRRCGSCGKDWHSYEQPEVSRMRKGIPLYSKDSSSLELDFVEMLCPVCSVKAEQETVSSQSYQQSVCRVRRCSSCDAAWRSCERAANISAQFSAQRNTKSRSARVFGATPASHQKKC